MTELKTLKDLERKDSEKYGMCNYCIATAKEQAIKWVKFCRDPGIENWSPKSLLEFWMDKLNITEEDLK